MLLSWYLVGLIINVVFHFISWKLIMKINVTNNDDQICLVISIIVFPYLYGILILFCSIGFNLLERKLK